MIYLSRLIGKTVLDYRDSPIGKIHDLIIPVLGQQYPVLTAVVIAEGKKLKRVPWDKIQHLDTLGMRINAIFADLPDFEIMEQELFLKEDLLDKQIVDTSGYRVVRINDIQLMPYDGDFRVIGVDVGTQGLLRRLGLENLGTSLAGVFKHRFAENIIPWDFVAPLDVKNINNIKLTVSHQKLTKMHPADLADILSDLRGKERDQLFSTLEDEKAAETLAEMEEEVQVSILNSLSDERASEILEEMGPDEAADLLAELPEERAKEILHLMEEEEAEDVKELLAYDEESAGGIMTTEYISLPEKNTAQETINLLRELSPDAETIYYLYVVDEKEKLRGVLSLRDLIVAKPDTPITEFMITNVFKVKVDSSLQEVADTITKYDLLAVPVVDDTNELKGIVMVDDVMDLIVPEKWRRKIAKSS